LKICCNNLQSGFLKEEMLKMKKKAALIAVFFFGINSFCCPIYAAEAKKTIAVAEFENKTNAYGAWKIGTGMADMLTDSLIQSGRFIVLERQTLNAVMAEQNLAASRRASKAGIGAQTGNIKKAQFLVQGTVTEFEQTVSTSNQGMQLFGVSLEERSAVAHVAVIIRLIDTTTSEVIASQRVEGQASASATGYSANLGVVGFGQGAFSQTPLGKATQMAIDRAVYFIASQMAARPWRGRVARVDEQGVIYVNAGSTDGMLPGKVLRISRPGENIVDPETGMELGQEAHVIGTIQIQEALEKYSKANPVYLSQPAQAGDILEAIQ